MDPAALKKIPLFATLSDKDLKQVGQWTDEVEVPAGDRLAGEGKFAYEFMAIGDGTAEVTREGEHLADLGPGDFFGEIALIETDRRTATVTAKTTMRLVVMNSRDFRAMTSMMPAVGEEIHRKIKERMGG